MNILGDFKRESRYDPDLARRVNEKIEQEEKRKALKDKLKGKKTPEPETPEESPLVIPAANLADPENYVLLKQTKDHPDILVAKYRLGLNPEVEQAAKSLNLQLQNTAKEQNG